MEEVTTKKRKSINKLLVVGHPQSEYKQVLELLHNCNIKSANPLKREGVEADKLSEILLKAHNIDNDFSKKIEQISVNPVWNGLAMDLMMSNLNHTKWAWADSKALPFLNYWSSLDADLLFILVYTSPQKFLENLIKNSNSSIDFDLALNEWFNYNRSLLNFYYRNQSSSLLVHSGQVQNNSQKYLLEISKQIGLSNNNVLKNKQKSNISLQKNETQPNNSLYQYFTQHLVDHHKQITELYQELQSVSHLPLADSTLTPISTSKAINSFILEKENIRTLTSELYIQEKENLALIDKISVAHSEIQSLENHLIEAKKDTKKSQKILELKTENEMLLKQLFTVQEELEKLYINTHANNSTTSQPITKQYLGAPDRIKKQLSYRLGAIMIKNSKSFFGLLTLPYTLYSEVIKFRSEKKTQKKLPPIHKYMDYYDAKKVKKHLSYRLGQAMIQSMKSPLGIFKLPFALKKAHTEYKEGKENV